MNGSHRGPHVQLISFFKGVVVVDVDVVKMEKAQIPAADGRNT